MRTPSVCLAIGQPILKRIVRDALQALPGVEVRDSELPLDQLLRPGSGRCGDVLIADADAASIDVLQRRLLEAAAADHLVVLSDHGREAAVLESHGGVRDLGSVSQGELRAEVDRLLQRGPA